MTRATPVRPCAILLMATMTLLAACRGCDKPEATAAAVGDDKPSVRLYLMSDIAGALEPCGCSKDQLGGLDHLAAFVRGQGDTAPRKLVLAAGPLFYVDPTLEPKQAAQDRWKAEAIADAMKSLELAAWVPGFNDWAAGSAELARLAERTGAKLLGLSSAQASTLFEIDGAKIGIVAVTAAKDQSGTPPPDFEPLAPEAQVDRVKRESASLRQRGAQVVIAMAAMPRGAALRIVDAVPDLNVLVIGKALRRGHANSSQPAPQLIGSTLVVETANHAQTIAVVDVFLRGDEQTPTLADAGGVAQAARAGELSRRIRELEHRINGWEKGGKVDPKDVAERRADLARLRAERDGLSAERASPAGSFFRISVHEVREAMGKDQAVSARMVALYRQINEHNKTALADLLPREASGDQARYIGVEACSDCHEEERKVWNATPHARAYATLVEGFKEYNLECVGCHVTGYGKPAGSTVTHNTKLQSVQCEECHGPGSKHAQKPEAKDLIVLKPPAASCIDACHHPPHVEGFDAEAKLELVLGPGHGKD